VHYLQTFRLSYVWLVENICLSVVCKIRSLTGLELPVAVWAVRPVTTRLWHCFCYLAGLFLSNPWRSLRTFKHCCANTWGVRICGWHFSLWNILVNKRLQKQREYFGLYWYWRDKGKSGFFSLIFAMVVVPPVFLSSGLLLFCLINRNDLQKLNRKVIPCSVVKMSPVSERGFTD